MFYMKRIEIENLKDQVEELKKERKELQKLEQLVNRFLILSNLETAPILSALAGLGPARRATFEVHIEGLEKAAAEKAEREKIEAVVRDFLQRNDHNRIV